jgi:hypothetical protein
MLDDVCQNHCNFRINVGNNMNNGNELFLEYHVYDEHS